MLLKDARWEVPANVGRITLWHCFRIPHMLLISESRSRVSHKENTIKGNAGHYVNTSAIV